MSLLEVLVASAIMSLLVTMAITVVLAITRYFHRALTSYELHQDAITALTSLSRELSSSHAGTVDRPATGGVAFAVPTLDLSQTPPALEWVNWVCYCSMPIKGEPALVRMEQPISPPSATVPSSIPFDKTVSAFQGSGLRSKLVAAHLKNFLVTQGGTITHPTATVVLELARDNPRRFSVKVTTSLPFRN